MAVSRESVSPELLGTAGDCPEGGSMEEAMREYIENRLGKSPATRSWRISRPASRETAVWVKCWPMHDAAVQPVLCRLARTQGTGQESRRDGVHVEDASAARRTSSLLNEI